MLRSYVAAVGETPDPCPVCGSRRRGRWTMLRPSVAFELDQFAARRFGQEFAPLALVSYDHPIWPTEAITKAR